MKVLKIQEKLSSIRIWVTWYLLQIFRKIIRQNKQLRLGELWDLLLKPLVHFNIFERMNSKKQSWKYSFSNNIYLVVAF